MSHFIEIIKKYSKIQDDISQIVDKYNNESYDTRSKIGQNVLAQSSVFKQAINVMCETINDMDVELEQKDNKKLFLENKVGFADDKVVEEKDKHNLNKIFNKDKKDRFMNRLNKTLNNHKFSTNQQQ